MTVVFREKLLLKNKVLNCSLELAINYFEYVTDFHLSKEEENKIICQQNMQVAKLFHLN